LRERHREKLVCAGEFSDFVIAFVSSNTFVKFVPRQEVWPICTSDLKSKTVIFSHNPLQQ
jgi:hypothetical protein